MISDPLQSLLNPDIQDFIHNNRNADVKALALKTPPSKAWPYPLILGQIKSRQKAAKKIPDWCKKKNVIFPDSALIEQASSYATASYKASISGGTFFVDLCAGVGVDSWALSKSFQTGTAIEADKTAADLLEHNFKILTPNKITVTHQSAEDYIREVAPCDLVYLDPQRRNNQKRGLYKLEDCSPNILALLPKLKDKAKNIMLKTSPMLDIQTAIKVLAHVSHIHILELSGECKEVLYLITPQESAIPEDIPISVVTLHNDGTPLHKTTFTKAQEAQAQATYAQPQTYLYEPGPALQKSGAYNLISKHYKIHKLHPSTHLYTAKTLIRGFPGRVFQITDQTPVQSKALKIKKANLTLRNFPGTVDALRKKLKLKEGGNDYIFACTLHDGKKALIHSVKTEKI